MMSQQPSEQLDLGDVLDQASHSGSLQGLSGLTLGFRALVL